MLSRDEFHRFRLLAFSFILVSSIASADLPSPQPSPALSSWSISIPDQLQKNVDFWIQINSHYTVNQGLVHDSENIHYVYSVLDLSRSKRNTDHLIQVEKAKWKKVLLSVHKKQAHPE